MDEPLISIIIPVYNTERYLDRCVDSIVNQTYKNLEILLVDDGSPDNCPKMCDEWAQRDSRIRVIHKDNDGLSNARNSGIAVCMGDYVMFVDSDDYIESDMAAFLLSMSAESGAAVSRCGFYVEEENKKPSFEQDFKEQTSLEKDEIIIDLVKSGLAGTAWNKLYKRDVIKTHLYDKADGCAEDIMHNFRVYKDIDRAVVHDVPKYHYVIREDSITNSAFSYGAFDIIRAKKAILEYAGDNENILPYAIKGYVMSAFIVLSGCIQNNAFPEDAKELIKGILSYKRQILTSDLYSKADKIKTLILSVSPKLYYYLIKRKYKDE